MSRKKNGIASAIRFGMTAHSGASSSRSSSSSGSASGGGAGWDLAALGEELGRRSAGLLDGDRFSQGGGPPLALAGGRDEDREQRPSHCFRASPSASPSSRSASSIWPLLTTIAGAIRSE